MVTSISETLIEDVQQPCRNDDCHGSIEDVEYRHRDDSRRVCTSCWQTEDGNFDPPTIRSRPSNDRLTAETTEGGHTSRPRYRKSGYVVQYGAFPDYQGEGGTRSAMDDGSTPHDELVSV